MINERGGETKPAVDAVQCTQEYNRFMLRVHGTSQRTAFVCYQGWFITTIFAARKITSYSFIIYLCKLATMLCPFR